MTQPGAFGLMWSLSCRSLAKRVCTHQLPAWTRPAHPDRILFCGRLPDRPAAFGHCAVPGQTRRRASPSWPASASRCNCCRWRWAASAVSRCTRKTSGRACWSMRARPPCWPATSSPLWAARRLLADGEPLAVSQLLAIALFVCSRNGAGHPRMAATQTRPLPGRPGFSSRLISRQAFSSSQRQSSAIFPCQARHPVRHPQAVPAAFRYSIESTTSARRVRDPVSDRAGGCREYSGAPHASGKTIPLARHPGRVPGPPADPRAAAISIWKRLRNTGRNGRHGKACAFACYTGKRYAIGESGQPGRLPALKVG